MSDEDANENVHNSNENIWINMVMTGLAIVGLLTIVIGGSLLAANALDGDDDRRERVVRVVPTEPDETEQVCYEEEVRRGGGLFPEDDYEFDDDFDAEAQFASDQGRQIVIICEEW